MDKYEENVYKNLFEYPTKKIAKLEIENADLQQRIDKAVEYIEKHKDNTGWVELSPFTTEETNLPDLLNILKGGDE